MAILTARSSMIFIATGDKTRVYRSVDDVPAKLKRKLQETTAGMNSATILIADKRGREELVRAVLGGSNEITFRFAESTRGRANRRHSRQSRRSRVSRTRTWLEILLPIGIAATLWFFVESRV